MIKCAVPFIEGFTKSSGPGHYRNCCATNPQIISKPEQSFTEWWQSKELNDFRESLVKDSLPKDCSNCELQEKLQGKSFRTAVNQTVDLKKIDARWPSRWNVHFGNVCNLACWTCNESSSSVILSHKKRLGLLDSNFQDPTIKFQKIWSTLKNDILNSYDYHEIVHLTILGGEPLYNKEVLNFLTELLQSKLSNRTKLEFHTNGTQVNKKITDILKLQNWKYISIFLSIDAVGKKAEWLRYGTNWNNIENNIPKLVTLSNYFEAHCTLSVLNIKDVVHLNTFCKQKNIKLHIFPIDHPWFMSLENWDISPTKLTDKKVLAEHGLEEYYNLIGKTPKKGAHKFLKSYIRSFDSIRSPLIQFDPVLAKNLEV